MKTENANEALRHYEMLYIIPVKYTVEELPKIQNNVKGILAEHNCQITYEEDLGKRKLAYPIGQVYHGYYFVMEFNMDPGNLSKLNTALRLDQELVRYLVVAKVLQTDEEKAKEKERRARQEAEEVEELKEKITSQKTAGETAKAVETPKAKAAAGKVSMEDLDKKLDELIDESIL